MVAHPGRVLLMLSVVVALLVAPTGATASTEQAPATRQAVEWGPTTWVGGAGGYSITGRLAGPSRQVRLEYKVAGGWRTLDATRSRKHAFSLAGAWEWYGVHQVRLRAPAGKGRPSKVLGKQRMTVTPEYVPRGLASEFVPFTDARRVFRFNPCRPIRWRFNSGGGAGDPLFGQLQTAVTLISRATGIRFTYVGTSRTVPLNVKKLERRTELVVAFGHEAQIPKLDGATAVGGTVRLKPAKGPGPRSYRTVQAGVTISIEKLFSDYYSTDEVSAKPTAILVFMHELGHAMGLDHVTKAGSDVEVMWGGPSSYIAPFPDGLHYPQWGAGDLAGFEKLGLASGCLR